MTPEETKLKADIQTALQYMKIATETIREAGEIPAGYLYAAFMGRMDLVAFEKMMSLIVSTGLVERDPSHLLRWVGPKEAQQ